MEKVTHHTISISHVFLFLLGLDGLMLVLHLLFANQSGFFHLDIEQNLPTVYQSIKLIFFGGLLMWMNVTNRIGSTARYFVIPLALFMTALGFDELFQIHENIYRVFEYIPFLHPSRVVEASLDVGYRSSLWVLYYLPIILLIMFWCGYWLRYFQTTIRHLIWPFIVSIVSLMSVLLMEVISSTGMASPILYFWLVTIEESMEMLFASTIIFIGLSTLDHGMKQSKTATRN